MQKILEKYNDIIWMINDIPDVMISNKKLAYMANIVKSM